MILLDTNVISALMRRVIEPPVAASLRKQRPERLCTSSVCEEEIRFGILRLPPGRRRDELEQAFRTFLDGSLANRIMPFDSFCAKASAVTRARLAATGMTIARPDITIAATALAHGATMATRNVADFERCGLTVENPWDPI
jgi:predicted nucleic acid-binding protein